MSYLHTLQRRNKWQYSKPNLYVGQIVILTDEQSPRDQWRLARIVSLKGDSENVRTVVVQTATGKTFERHCTKLVPLELD